MRNWNLNSLLAVTIAALTVSALPAMTQGTAPKMSDGKPDLNGIWQAFNNANWDLQDHSPQQGPLWQLGAIGAEPAGQSVVAGGSIPYKPEKLAKKKAN